LGTVQKVSFGNCTRASENLKTFRKSKIRW